MFHSTVQAKHEFNARTASKLIILTKICFQNISQVALYLQSKIRSSYWRGSMKKGVFL